MKTILFFDRSDLTNLYILLTKELIGKVNIIHVAFSNREVNLLKDAGIDNYINYTQRLELAVDELHESDELINEIDSLIISESKGLFNLNGSIQSDRGFTLLSYMEALHLACCHYTIWKKIFEEHKADIVYHEPASQFMTHILALLCKKQGGLFLYPTQLQSDYKGFTYLNIDGENNTCKELESYYSKFLESPESIDLDRCKRYIDKFRASYEIAFGTIVTPQKSKIRLMINALKNTVYLCLNRNKYDRIKNNIDYWILHNNKALNKLYNLRQYKKRIIKFMRPVEGDKYFYYSMHLEPEATVLYLSGGTYTNQIKLIENIAASLPAGYYLYVKDHPHEFAYRKADDYERLIKVPNIRLIDQSIPGKELVKGAVGVFSINGTACFEALMLGKYAYCFGKTYFTYCPLVRLITNIKDLRNIIYNDINNKINTDWDNQLLPFVSAYLCSMHLGFVTYFGKERVKKSGINEVDNARIIAEDIVNNVLSQNNK